MARSVRGVRQRLPPNSLVGRINGSGAAQIVSLEEIAAALQITGGSASTSSSGSISVAAGTGISVAYAAGAYTVSLSTPVTVGRGGTGADLSATGGAGKVLKQLSAGAAITVATLSASEVTGLATIATSGSASDLGSGTVASARISGGYTSITAVGTLSAGGANFVPSANTDLVNFEALLSVQFKGTCTAATDGALPSCTYANGSSGVGATLTATANGSLSPLDGATLIATSTVLVKDQASGLQNGIYTVTQLGDGSHPFILTRVYYYDEAVAGSLYSAEVKQGDVVPVAFGTVNAATLWLLNSAGSGGSGSFVIGTDTLTFVHVAGGQHYDIACFVPGVLANSQKCLYHRFSKAVTIPANFGAYRGRSSQAGGSANATGSTVINVDKAATATPNTFSNVGTITIAAASVTPTFATSGGTAVSFAQGDVLRVVAPGTADATFADFYATLCGFET